MVPLLKLNPLLSQMSPMVFLSYPPVLPGHSTILPIVPPVERLPFKAVVMPNLIFAQDAMQQSAPSAWGPLIMFGGFFILIYFLMIRPQNKRQKELVNMIAALEKNDEIITASGILGKVIEIKGAYISVNVGDNQTLKFQKSAVSSVLPKGTIDSIK